MALFAQHANFGDHPFKSMGLWSEYASPGFDQ